MALTNARTVLRQSFNIPPPSFTEEHLPDQTGRVVIVTGGYAGVGQELSRILYAKNASVYIAGRSSEKAKKSIDATKDLFPHSKGKIEFLPLDLADLATIKGAASAFTSKEERLDVLVNNAGVMAPPKGSITAQGHELQMGTNVLGPFLFTKFLLPVLAKTAASGPPDSVRVLWAGSATVHIASPPGGVQFDNNGNPVIFGAPRKDYAQSKAANLFLASAFGRRVEEQYGGKVLQVPFNPGNLSTELQRHADGIVKGILRHTILYPAKLGAYTELWAGWANSLAQDGKGIGRGIYAVPWGQNDWSAMRPDVLKSLEEGKDTEKLWDWCEKETKTFQ